MHVHRAHVRGWLTYIYTLDGCEGEAESMVGGTYNLQLQVVGNWRIMWTPDRLAAEEMRLYRRVPASRGALHCTCRRPVGGAEALGAQIRRLQRAGGCG